MKKIQFTKDNNDSILFGIILPDILYDMYNIAMSKQKFEQILRFRLNIHPKRLIRLAEAVVIYEKKEILILVIYDIFMSESQMLKNNTKIEVEDFDFPTYNYEKDMNIENMIELRRRLK